MKIYTKTGDEGETGLFAGPRVRKDDPRIEAYGAVDELNAHLGAARAAGPPDEINALLESIQHQLFAVGAELATPDPAAHATDIIAERHIDDLERAIDRFEEQLAPLKQFILPGGGNCGAALHVARTVCRRAERRVVTLVQAADSRISLRIVRYLNRLGDLLFVLARAANASAGKTETPWTSPQ